MSNYISVYDDVLKPNQCQHLIEKFEDSKQQWIKTELKGHRSFTEINLNVNEDWQEYEIFFKDLFLWLYSEVWHFIFYSGF